MPEQAANQNTMFQLSRFFPTGREASDADATGFPGNSSHFPRVATAMRGKSLTHEFHESPKLKMLRLVMSSYRRRAWIVQQED